MYFLEKKVREIVPIQSFNSTDFNDGNVFYMPALVGYVKGCATNGIIALLPEALHHQKYHSPMGSRTSPTVIRTGSSRQMITDQR